MMLVGWSEPVGRQRFLDEMAIMKSLSGHPNIIPLIGCVTTTQPLSIIMEYASNGDLLSYLHSMRASEKVYLSLSQHVFL